MKKIKKLNIIRSGKIRIKTPHLKARFLNTGSQISAERLWDMVCGEESTLSLFAQSHGLHYLVQGINVETIEDDDFQAYVTIDPDDSISPLIIITTGTYSKIFSRMQKGIEILRKTNFHPWLALGWDYGDFQSSLDFCRFMCNVTMDFVALHELSHISRGHLAYYMEFCPAGLFEVDGDTQVLPNQQRIALELDADSVAIYHFIGLSDFLIANSNLYGRIKNIEVYIATIGLASKILFGILGETRQPAKFNNLHKSLNEYHKQLSHPHPSVREEFAHQRIAQLAIDETERLKFQTAMKKSYALFMEMVSNNLFPLISMESWQHRPEELAEFLNLLIDEIGMATEKGWITENSRLSKALDVIQSLQ